MYIMYINEYLLQKWQRIQNSRKVLFSVKKRDFFPKFFNANEPSRRTCSLSSNLVPKKTQVWAVSRLVICTFSRAIRHTTNLTYVQEMSFYWTWQYREIVILGGQESAERYFSVTSHLHMKRIFLIYSTLDEILQKNARFNLHDFTKSNREKTKKNNAIKLDSVFCTDIWILEAVACVYIFSPTIHPNF